MHCSVVLFWLMLFSQSFLRGYGVFLLAFNLNQKVVHFPPQFSEDDKSFNKEEEEEEEGEMKEEDNTQATFNESQDHEFDAWSEQDSSYGKLYIDTDPESER